MSENQRTWKWSCNNIVIDYKMNLFSSCRGETASLSPTSKRIWFFRLANNFLMHGEVHGPEGCPESTTVNATERCTMWIPDTPGNALCPLLRVHPTRVTPGVWFVLALGRLGSGHKLYDRWFPHTGSLFAASLIIPRHLVALSCYLNLCHYDSASVG